MKGYDLDGTLYIFETTADAIPYVAEDVTKICIQQESLDAFKEANPDYATLMVPYNYNVMTVQKKEWADYVDEDLVSPEPTPDPEPTPELPEQGTLYDFVGYLTEEATEPSSTGQITYEGEYSEDTNYVYGDAEVTFTGSDTPQQLTVYMTKDDLFTTLDGGRAQVYILQNSEMTSIGYGELVAAPVFQTLNITQDAEYNISASLQTDTDWTGKELYASAYGEDTEHNPITMLYLKLKADTTDPTLLVFDDYDGTSTEEMYLDEMPDGTCEIYVSETEKTYKDVNYSWTNEVVSEPEP